MIKFIIIFFSTILLFAETDNKTILNEFNQIESQKDYPKFLEVGKNEKQYSRIKNFWDARLFNSQLPRRKQLLSESFLAFDTIYPQMIWHEMGPYDKPDNSIAAISGNGRINLIKFDPKDSSVIYAASAGGGLWKSTDSGHGWEIVYESEFLSMGICDFIISYDDSQVMYIATGDVSGGPLFRGYSSGILKTVDGGHNWFRVGDSLMLSENIYVTQIVQDHKNPNIIYVSSSESIKKSVDGGETWTTLIDGDYFRHLVMHPEDNNILYSSTMSYTDSTFIYRTTDAGENWEKIIESDNVIRTGLAVTPAAPDHIYAMQADQIRNNMKKLMYSNDKGDNWKEISPHIDTLDLIYSQGFYNNILYVDPRDTNKITAAGVFINYTSDFGKTWTDIQTEDIHVDYHNFVYNSVDSCLYIANDGGVYKMPEYNHIKKGDTVQFVNLSKGLGITQFYRIGLNHLNDSLFFAGSQDNGTFKYSYGEYLHANGGDGMECYIGNSNQNIVYVSDQMGNLYKSEDMGNKFKQIYEYEYQERKNWIRQFAVNPLNEQSIYAGYTNIWKSDKLSGWYKLTNFTDNVTVAAMTMSEADTNLIFFAKQNKLYSIDLYDQQINELYQTIPAISYIYVNEDNINEFYISLSGYNDSLKVIIHEDGVFKNISYNLPNIPVNTIIKNEMNNDIIIGTDAGVYLFDRNTSEWKLLGRGLPKVTVNEIEILYGKGELYAATFGRGLWKLKMWSCEIFPPQLIQSGFIEMCEDSEVALTYEMSDDIYEYYWSNGETSDSVITSKAGEYYVTAVSPEGCIAPSKKMSIKTYMKPEVQLLLKSGNPVCEGEPVILSANLIRQDTSGDDSYEFIWSNGDTTLTTYIYESGEYYLEVFSEKGCYYRTDPYEVIINKNPEMPSIRQQGEYLVTDTGSVIRWYLNGKRIKDKNSNILKIDTLGVYQAEVFNEKFCSNFTEEIEINIINNSNLKFDVYPNPFSDKIILESYLDENLNEIKISIYDISGKIVYKNIFEHNKYLNKEIYLNDLSIGVYFLRIEIDGKEEIIKLIKNN